MDEGEKLSAIPRLKEAGNALYLEKKYDEAADKYAEALGMLENLLLKYTTLIYLNISLVAKVWRCMINTLKCTTEIWWKQIWLFYLYSKNTKKICLFSNLFDLPLESLPVEITHKIIYEEYCLIGLFDIYDLIYSGKRLLLS